MNEILTGIFIAVVAGILLSWFGFNKRTTVVQLSQTGTTPKKWKWWLVLGWIMFLAGIYLFSVHFQESGFYDPMTGFGFSLGFIGLVSIWIGKFGRWWNNS